MRTELWTELDERNEATLKKSLGSGDLAGALLSIEGAKKEHWNKLRSRLQRWGYDARQLMTGSAQLTADQALVRVLAQEAGFEGDADDYHHPRNSYLTQVVAQRRGMPILLSCIYTLVGRAAGIDVSGISLPGHFMVRVGEVLLDPFHGGDIRTEEECKEMISQLASGAFAWRSSFLDDTSVSSTIERVLRNLIHSHKQLRQREELYRVVRLLAAMTPGRADTQLFYARITEEVGAHRMALDLYEGVIEVFPESPEAAMASSRLGPLHTRSRMLN